MKSFIFVALLVASANAGAIVRPSYDSAVIKTERSGGNFAYSVAEAPAFGVINPVVSHVTQPVATVTVEQPINTITTSNIVAPAQTAQIITADATPVISPVTTVQQQVIPSATLLSSGQVVSGQVVSGQVVSGQQIISTPVVSGQQIVTSPVNTVATTYGANWPYTTSTQQIVDTSSPIIYSAKTNLVGVETEKQINQVHSVRQVQQPLTYTVQQTGTPVATAQWATVQQPSTIVSGTPLTYSVQQTGTPVTWSTVQQPNSIVSTSRGTVGTPLTWSTGSTGLGLVSGATTYSVPSTSVITSGTPTFKTVTGTTTLGLNQWGTYGLGQPWNTVVV